MKFENVRLMRPKPSRFKKPNAFIVSLLLICSPSLACAQSQAQAQSPNLSAQALSDSATLASALKRTNEKNKADFEKNNEQAWTAVLTLCGSVDLTGPKITLANQQCIHAAIFAANAECSASAKYFKKDTKKWQVFSIVLTLVSAGFTGVGASATLANAKIYSTLGGTTGLGPLLPTLNANANSDQTGLAGVAAILAKLQAIEMPTGTPPVDPTPEQIFTQARSFGAQCAAAATSSPASGSSTKPSQP